MRKFFFIALVLLSFGLRAQDSLEVEQENVRYTEADIVRDTSTVVLKTFSVKFKEKYKDDEFNYNPKPKELTAWDRFKAWLGNLLSSLFNLGGTASSVVGWIIRILAIVLVIGVIFLIVRAIMNKEGQWIFGRSTTKRILSAEEIEKNIQSADFEKLIAETLQSGDQRLAIRYYYLWLLQKFSKRGIIQWDIEKTNSDYLYEIAKESDKKQFAYLSYLYNYIWYGEFEIDGPTFEKAVASFKQTLNNV